jgi:hypothetical protein
MVARDRMTEICFTQSLLTKGFLAALVVPGHGAHEKYECEAPWSAAARRRLGMSRSDEGNALE